MNVWRPHSLKSRLSIALAAAFACLSACQPAGEGGSDNDPDAEEQANLTLPSVPRPEPPMDRAALLMAVARAASAAAAGADDMDRQRLLAGARFELRIRFGCRGPVPDLREAVLGWTFDEANRTLRIRATPTITREDAIVQEIVRELDGEHFEAIEGFWIPRPWLLDPACPAQPDAEADVASATTDGTEIAPVEDEQESQAPPPARPKIGIARFFTEADPRTRRRQMRPYETVETLDTDQPPGLQGFNLVLSGRLRALPGRRVIACVSEGPDAPPECIVSADFDRVWIERADSREILAEWGSG